MKSTKYSTEITTQNVEKSENGKLGCTASLACLLNWYQLKKYSGAFNEKCFEVFDQSNHAVDLTWYIHSYFSGNLPLFTLNCHSLVSQNHGEGGHFSRIFFFNWELNIQSLTFWIWSKNGESDLSEN